MGEEIRWLIGIAVSIGGAIMGVFWVAYRSILAKFDSVGGKIDITEKDLAKQIKDGDDALHERINRTRDDYVRRVDFNDQLTRVGSDLKELRADIRRGQEEERQGRREMMQLLQSAISLKDREN